MIYFESSSIYYILHMKGNVHHYYKKVLDPYKDQAPFPVGQRTCPSVTFIYLMSRSLRIQHASFEEISQQVEHHQGCIRMVPAP